MLLLDLSDIIFDVRQYNLPLLTFTYSVIAAIFDIRVEIRTQSRNSVSKFQLVFGKSDVYGNERGSLAWINEIRSIREMLNSLLYVSANHSPSAYTPSSNRKAFTHFHFMYYECLFNYYIILIYSVL